jgi:hypothetical protein
MLFVGTQMNGINKKIFTALLVLLPALSMAGGDAVSVRVVSVLEENNAYLIHFMQSDNSPELFTDCREMKVTVKYSRVPWFTWLPFIKSGHPTRKETIDAIEHLRKANREKEPVNFGYMGNGLVPTGVPCSFVSKGLKKIIDDNKLFIVSFHDET